MRYHACVYLQKSSSENVLTNRNIFTCLHRDIVELATRSTGYSTTKLPVRQTVTWELYCSKCIFVYFWDFDTTVFVILCSICLTHFVCWNPHLTWEKDWISLFYEHMTLTIKLCLVLCRLANHNFRIERKSTHLVHPYVALYYVLCSSWQRLLLDNAYRRGWAGDFARRLNVLCCL